MSLLNFEFLLRLPSYFVFYLNVLNSTLKCFSSVVKFVWIKETRKLDKKENRKFTKKIQKKKYKKLKKEKEEAVAEMAMESGLELHGEQ